MKNKTKRVLLITLIAMVILFGGISYAYFSANISGAESESTILTSGGTLTIHYEDGNENIIMSNVYPREKAWITKTITLTGTNTTDLKMQYELGLQIDTNGFSDYLRYDLEQVSETNVNTNGVPIANKSLEVISGTGYRQLGIGMFTTANNSVHKYILKLYFKDNNTDQSSAEGQSFAAKVVVKSYDDIAKINFEGGSFRRRVISGTTTVLNTSTDLRMSFSAELPEGAVIKTDGSSYFNWGTT